METQATERMQHDYEVVCAARDNGSREAFAELMSTYREPLYLLLLRMTHNTTAADDLTMETFGKAFHQLQHYAPTGTFSSWLYTIGINTYIDHLRRNKIETIPLSQTSRDDGHGPIEYQIPSSQPDPEEAMIRLERDEALAAIIAQMKEPYRQIIQLRYYDDLSYEEIAQRIGVPIGTVKIRLSRAKAIISAIVKRKGGLQ